LELDPLDYEDSDAEKRLRVYQREGFVHARSIGYNRRSLATNEQTPMEILYWSPNNDPEAVIYEKMKKMYEDIHTYKDEQVYGKSYQPVDEVLTFDQERDADYTLKRGKAPE